MRIWILATGEPLPLKGSDARLFRVGNLHKFLRSKGHSVVWWTSSYNHMLKRQLTVEEQEQLESEGIKCISSPGYSSVLGVRRLVDHFIVGVNAYREMKAEEQEPDIILCSYPTMELSFAGVRFGKRSRVPVVVDVRDLWPDIFLEAIPGTLRPFAKLILAPYYGLSKLIFQQCKAITALTDGYLEWANARGGLKNNAMGQVFPMGYPDFKLSEYQMIEGRDFWLAKGVDPRDFNICFFGALGRHSDISTVIKAADILSKADVGVRFVICGDGSNRDEYISQAKNIETVMFPGHVDKVKIKALMDVCAVGLAPYVDIENYQRNIPNKIYEYAAGSLPTLCGVHGEVSRYLSKHDIGRCYKSGDAESLVASILSLKAESVETREQGVRARRLYLSRFESDIVSRKIEDFLLTMS